MPGPIGRQRVVFLDAPLVAGDYNVQTRDWDNAAEVPVSGCTVDYASSSESTQAGDQTVTRATVWLPRRAPRVTEWQRARWDGRTWEVEGVPSTAEGAGPLSGQVLSLLEVAG